MAGELLELLVAHDPKLKQRVTARVVQVISNSFTQDKSRVTQSETARRFRIIETLMRELRREHGWAWERILDALPLALRCRLDRHPWDPALHRNSWGRLS